MVIMVMVKGHTEATLSPSGICHMEIGTILILAATETCQEQEEETMTEREVIRAEGQDPEMIGNGKEAKDGENLDHHRDESEEDQDHHADEDDNFNFVVY
mmetsp:Transcript_14285/g.18520  ORF Transcript_14285/g.18520 Transcript_14285/m.18520 type:complete len:100 (-) Transcript_14285:262-561(-)